MARKSISRGKAVEKKTMVICPKCGGKEFKFGLGVEAVSLYRIYSDGREQDIQYEAVSISEVERTDPGFTCTNCLARFGRKVA